MSRYEKTDLAYNFMLEKEVADESFTMEELSDATGWEVATCKTYPSKRWHQYIHNDGDYYTTAGIKYLSKEEFRIINSQKLQSTIDYSTKGILLNKAKEFALIGVSTYNNPHIKFKTYGFIVTHVSGFKDE